MYTFLLVLLIINCIVLAVAIMLQAGKGGGLAASFGGASTSMDFLGARQAGTLLTRVSWWGGGVFIALSFILALMSTRTTVPRSVLDQQFGAPLPAPQTIPAPGQAPGPAPALPLEPAPQTPPPQP